LITIESYKPSMSSEFLVLYKNYNTLDTDGIIVSFLNMKSLSHVSQTSKSDIGLVARLIMIELGKAVHPILRSLYENTRFPKKVKYG
jgi:hypothetical protein